MGYVIAPNAANPYNMITQPGDWANFEANRPKAYTGTGTAQTQNETPQTGGNNFWENVTNTVTPEFLGSVGGLISAIKGTSVQNQNDNAALFAAMQAEQKRQQSTMFIVGAVIVVVIAAIFILKK